MLRGKRLAFVGDSLNRNMWESLACILRSSLKDKDGAYEITGRKEFKHANSYAYKFSEYNCTIEFFRSPFLVQEWEAMSSNGTRKESLRLDVMDRVSSIYKTADVIVFNTGHWWTHEKTPKGKRQQFLHSLPCLCLPNSWFVKKSFFKWQEDFYQEGHQVH
ncbi:hypothetical protein HPP92_027554 [Vanilla planifolia]|uniref:Trichome birefringence-like C-terminal domain-containing protein n=1 Tax=Vanilla planifolia TaxID=51239 RepID=A0A835P8K0_VANPL|nr:hypothetical protein HPP92_027554 [Vanilla planifolia]